MKRCVALSFCLALTLISCSRSAPERASDPASDEAAREKPTTGVILSLEETARLTAEQLAASIPSFFENYPSPTPLYPVRSYAVRFTSQDFDGSPVEIKAQLFVPEASGEFPLYAFASGTTGIGDECAPSLERPEQRRWGWYTQNMLAYATLGYVVMFPDYTGFNDPARPQRYFSKLAEGRMMLDAIRAARAAFPIGGMEAKPGNHTFTAGYSDRKSVV